MVKCIVFDCDGTLVDSEYLCHLGLEIKLREYAVDIPASEMMSKYRGWKLANILAELETQFGISLNESFVHEYRATTANLFEEQLRPCTGVAEALAKIKLPKCVASNGPQEKIKKALSVCKLSQHFNGNIYSAYDINSWKPEPGLLIYAAEQMGFSPEECLLVDDTELGINSAKSAGMPSILFDPDKLTDPEGGLKTIRNMNELPGKLSQAKGSQEY